MGMFDSRNKKAPQQKNNLADIAHSESKTTRETGGLLSQTYTFGTKDAIIE